MRSAGLKNITAKHLALASQALSIMINLIPYIRECLRRHLRAKQAVILVEFDKLKRDYQEHQYEIHAKLVAIMGDRLAVHCAALQEIDWEVDRTTDDVPNPYMQTLVKETATLHKVLYKYLPGSALETVMLQVLSAINSRLAEEYGRIAIKSDAARDRILQDAQFMKSKFSELKGLEREIPGAGLEDLIRMKKVEQSQSVPQQKQFTTPSLTRSRGSISQHKRTTSTASLLKAEQPATTSSEATTPDIASATEKSEALDIKPDIHPEQPSSVLVQAAAEVSSAIESQPDVSPEDVPLPPSPSLETSEPSVTEAGTVGEPRHPSDSVLGYFESAPATPVKDEAVRSPPVPDKPVSPPPTLSKSPPPASNVKNRLAGLFSKKPTASLPKVELPKVSIPALPNINLSNLRTDRMFSPERQQGSPAQARSSLDLPRARALMERHDGGKQYEEAIPEYEDVPLTAADAIEAAASAHAEASKLVARESPTLSPPKAPVTEQQNTVEAVLESIDPDAKPTTASGHSKAASAGDESGQLRPMASDTRNGSSSEAAHEATADARPSIPVAEQHTTIGDVAGSDPSAEPRLPEREAVEPIIEQKGPGSPKSAGRVSVKTQAALQGTESPSLDDAVVKQSDNDETAANPAEHQPHGHERQQNDDLDDVA